MLIRKVYKLLNGIFIVNFVDVILLLSHINVTYFSLPPYLETRQEGASL